MDALFILFVIGVIGVILIGSILGLTSSGRISKLEVQNRNLNARLKALEAGRSRNVQPPTTAPETRQQTHPETPPAPKPAPVPWHEQEVQTEGETILAASPAVPKSVREPVAASQSATAAAVKTAPDAAAWSQTSPPPEKPTRSLEEIIGGQWSVWVGGLALLVGAVLLIRFSIEAGFFGPTARIAMAVALGAALLLAGEWLKRADDKVLTGRLGEAAKALQGNASIPGLLSAVGIFTLLGASYAAHELYGLIPALAAFAALALIALGAMALSLRQGPLLAAIGLLASLATPLLIQTNTPSLLMLVIYLVLIGAAALVLSRRTGWGWLATGTVFGWLGWSTMSLGAATDGHLSLWSVFLALGFGVTVWFAAQYKSADRQKIADLDMNLQPALALLWGAIAAGLVFFVATALTNRLGGLGGLRVSAIVLSVLSLAALFSAAIFAKRQAPHLITAGLLAIGLSGTADYTNAALQHFIFAAAVALAVVLALKEAFHLEKDGERGEFEIFWPAVAIFLGLGSVIYAYDYPAYRAGALDYMFAAWALGYGVLFAAGAIYFQSKSRAALMTTSLTIGAALAWALAATFAFDNLAVSLALSLGGLISVFAVWTRRLPGARLALLGLIGLVFAHALWMQFPDVDSISTRPVFNALWIYLMVPTAILGAAAYVLHGRRDETAFAKFLNGAVEAAALAGLALFAVFQIRHVSNGGAVYADSLGHAELGLQTSIGLCFTLAGLSKRFAGNLVLSKIAEIISYVTLAVFAFGSLFILSPLFARSEPVTGNLLFNSLTTGLLVPAGLFGLCAVFARGRRPETYINILGGLALAGALAWVTAMIRFIYNGKSIQIFRTGFGDLELWTISAVWLAFGIALLTLGVWRRERALRIASGIVIILTVLKAFLIDMAGLEGVLRALSFVVLGLILIVIGRAYQRFWLSDQVKENDA